MNDRIRELVICNVQVTSALARRIRKAAAAEQEGRDARSALMMAAGCDPDELDGLQAQVRSQSDDLDEIAQRLASVKATADERSADLSQVRKKLSERDETIANLRSEEKVAEGRITTLDESLKQSVGIGGLPTNIVDEIRAMVQAFRNGVDPRSAFLAAANYDRDAVDDALNSIDCLKTDKAELESRVAPLNATLVEGGVRAWIVRQILGLKNETGDRKNRVC